MSDKIPKEDFIQYHQKQPIIEMHVEGYPVWTECIDCGVDVAVDEDGCCSCGRDALRFGVVGPQLKEAIAILEVMKGVGDVAEWMADLNHKLRGIECICPTPRERFPNIVCNRCEALDSFPKEDESL